MAIVLAAITSLAGLTAAATAAPSSTKLVEYRGYAIRVPTGWPVYHLTGRSTVCVRFNRHAVYLGSPSSRQRCPAHALGRTEAILVAPLAASGARNRASALPLEANAGQTQFAVRAHGLQVTATWNRKPALIRRALGHKLASPPQTAIVAATRRPAARAASAPHQTGTVYNGLGVDACSAPSTTQMTAWGGSPYRAIGVYIGGTNMACSQPNLTAAWVAQEWGAGWHLIPTYVGLQAPTNSCGCKAIVPSQASAEGTAAAQDAVAHAQAVAIGAGNPIYDDMESYTRTTTNTSAVLAYLAAWTSQLHAEGYVSGVYGSSDSGMVDLSTQVGTTYPEPDDIWIANWNGVQTTSDPNVPSSDWAANERLHQYRGGHNETYNGVTINVDNDYLDGATAFGAGNTLPPSLKVSPGPAGAIKVSASWQGGIGQSSWLILGGASPTSLSAVSQNPVQGAVSTISEGSEYPYYEAEALGSAGQVLAASAAVATGPHIVLYGRSAFVPAQGLVGVPAGCFTGSTCRIALSIWVGRKRIAHSGRELLSSSGGLLYFKLSQPDRTLLANARGRRLPVTVLAKDISGTSTSTTMNLTPFQTSGPDPRRSSTPDPTLRIIGLSDFVYRRAVGGILAGCAGSAPCLIKTTLTARGKTIATTGPEFIGANEAGYLNFKLSAYGRTLLTASPGNQLGARVTLSDASATAHASIVLSSFS